MRRMPGTICRQVIQECADCDTCRFLMDEDCLFFPELYRIVDTKENTGRIPDERTLRNLVDLCTLCGLCPCSSIRTQITKAKAAFARSRGVPLRSRVLADLQWIGRACSLLPKFANSAASSKPVQVAIKKLMGIHPKREMPLIPHQSFFAWAKNRGLCTPRDNGHGVAYFLRMHGRLSVSRGGPGGGKGSGGEMGTKYTFLPKRVAACPPWWKALRQRPVKGPEATSIRCWRPRIWDINSSDRVLPADT